MLRGYVSPELETLDQLLGGHMPLAVIRNVYPNDEGFRRGISGLLANGDIRLLEDGAEMPAWRWNEALSDDVARFSAALTDAGAKRIR